MRLSKACWLFSVGSSVLLSWMSQLNSVQAVPRVISRICDDLTDQEYLYVQVTDVIDFMDFTGALAECQNLGGELAPVLNNRTHALLREFIEELPSNLVSKIVWIGLHDKLDEGGNLVPLRFRWVDETETDTSFYSTAQVFPWASNEPDDISGKENAVE